MSSLLDGDGEFWSIDAAAGKLSVLRRQYLCFEPAHAQLLGQEVGLGLHLGVLRRGSLDERGERSEGSGLVVLACGGTQR